MGALQALNTASAGGFVEEDLHLLAALAGLASQGINRIQMIAMTHNANRALQEAQDERLPLGPRPKCQYARGT